MGVSLHALLLFSFLCFWTKESGAETTFVKLGVDLLLQLEKPITLEEDQTFSWRVKGSTNIIRLSQKGDLIISKRLKERVEFFSHNQTLLIKNLTLADSQFYTAVVTEDDDKVIANYTIQVQDTVSPVVLNASSVSLVDDSCNVTVTCSAASSDVYSTFRCNNQTCEQEGGEQSHTSSGSILHFSLLNGSIIACNHSNRVSWTNDMKEIQHFCRMEVLDSGLQRYKVVLIVGACVLFILFCIIGVVVYCKKPCESCKIMSSTNTEYETPQESWTTRTPIRNDAEDQLASPFSIYSLAVAPNPPDVLPLNPNRDEAETVYAQVKKPNRVTEIEMNNQNG